LIDELGIDYHEYKEVYTPHCFNLVNLIDDRIVYSVIRN
jgi:hypothetical protein